MPDVILIGMDIDQMVKNFMADNPGVGYEQAYYEVKRNHHDRFISYCHQAVERPKMRLQDGAAKDLNGDRRR